MLFLNQVSKFYFEVFNKVKISNYPYSQLFVLLCFVRLKCMTYYILIFLYVHFFIIHSHVCRILSFFLKSFEAVYCKLRFTPYKGVDQLQSMELQEKELKNIKIKQEKLFRKNLKIKSCLLKYHATFNFWKTQNMFKSY